MNREKVIVILRYYRDADKAIKMNERVIKNLEDQYYSTLGAVNSDGMPHGKGTTSNPVERVVLNIPRSVTQTIDRLRREIEEIGKIKAEIAEELKCLNYTEKALIQGFYIEGWTVWQGISAQTKSFRAIASRKNKIATHCPFSVVKLVLWKMNTTIRTAYSSAPFECRKRTMF